MKDPFSRLTRRDTMRLSGMALGGLAFGGARRADAQCTSTGPCYPIDDYERKSHQYSLFGDLDLIGHPLPAVGHDEMRITFIGSGFPPPRRAQQEMSVFVEVGNGGGQGEADQVIFDVGSGVTTNYSAMGISFGRMNKIFVNHLHGDHMGDLAHIYCFGGGLDRKFPLYVWGPGPSGVKSPRPPRRLYDDGTRAFCKNLREACRWHSESFSFLSTALAEQDLPTREDWGLPCDPVAVGDDPADDGYALVPIELDWTKVGGVAYDNPKTGVRITHFPVVHCRKGSIGYKLEWNGLSMVYTSDTKPERNCIAAARNQHRGVDVFIHEMILPPELMAMKNLRMDEVPYPKTDVFEDAEESAATVIDSSHTPPGAFGYLLSQIEPRPRLAVATHFPVADDTAACALRSVQNHCPWVQQLGKDAASRHPMTGEYQPYITWSIDLMVISVTKDEIKQLRGVVTDFAWPPMPRASGDVKPPKYWKWGVDENGNPVKVSDPRAQLDVSTVIEPGPDTYCEDGY